VECRLVGQRAAKQRLVSFQVCQHQTCKPIRPAWIQMAPDFDLIVLRQSGPPFSVLANSLARAEQARICQKRYSGVIYRGYLQDERGLGKDTQLLGTCDCLSPVGDVEFAIDTGRVGFDGAQCHDELPGNLLVSSAYGHEMEHFQLALA